jgi:hypothetical protein
MSDFNDLLKAYGVEGEATAPGQLKNKGGYYKHSAGKKKGLVGKMAVTYVDAEGKKTKPDTAGAKAAYANLKLVVIEDSGETIINKDYTLKEDIQYGRYVYNIFIPFASDKQWQNVQTFSDFNINGQPKASVIQGEKGKEDIYLNNLFLYYGTPVEWELEEYRKKDSKKDSEPLIIMKKDSLLLLDHGITPEVYKSRKTLMDKIMSLLEAKLAAEKDADDVSVETVEVDNPDEFLKGFK